MGKLWNCGQSLGDAIYLYDTYLRGGRPERGVIAAAGPALYFCGAGMPGGTPVPGEKAVWTSVDAARTEGALRNFRDCRRLPQGTVVISSAEGIRILKTEEWQEPEEKELFEPPYMLEQVLTEKEVEAVYGLPPRKVKTDCEKGLFGPEEARISGQNWLITKAAAAFRYGRGPEQNYSISPLLIVYTTLEAGQIWNRPGEDVRSAAAGAGHRAARMDWQQSRRAGRTWLVARRAMEAVYGDPWPGRWADWSETWRKALRAGRN